MTSERTDEIAREAARLLEIGRVTNLDQAIRSAAESLGCADAVLPGHGQVRRHAQAMAMQAQGESAYRESVRNIWRIAEEIMSALEEACPDGESLLVGRAAKGQIDAGVTLHIRVYTRTALRIIVESLVQFGYPEPAFETARTRFGRLDRVRFLDDGHEILITRCLPEQIQHASADLFLGRPVATASIADLRKRLATPEA